MSAALRQISATRVEVVLDLGHEFRQWGALSRPASRDQWQGAITLGLQAKGMSNELAASEAALMLSQLEGAMMLARIRRSREPMDQARDAVLSRLAPA